MGLDAVGGCLASPLLPCKSHHFWVLQAWLSMMLDLPTATRLTQFRRAATSDVVTTLRTVMLNCGWNRCRHQCEVLWQPDPTLIRANILSEDHSIIPQVG